jgi:hypothetical protein
MDVNKYTIRQDGGLTDKTITFPIQLDWDYSGLDQAIDEFEVEAINKVIGVGRDFEVTRFAHAPQNAVSVNLGEDALPISPRYNPTDDTYIQYQFYFHSGGTSVNNVNNWSIDYRQEGFTAQQIFYYNNNFSNSFFKLDLYDNVDEKKQTNYVTIILPTQQGLTMDAIMNKTLVKIKKPDFVLDYVGDKEGFFIYWLKKRTFLNVRTFYMTAKFYDAEKGVFVKMMNMPQSVSSGTTTTFDNSKFFYYRVELDYEKQTYQVFNTNPAQNIYNNYKQRAGTSVPIKWYEYVNP